MIGKTLNNEERMIGYLLREAPETAWEALETEFFADPALLAQLEATELDLIEGYVCGKLPAARRDRFEQVYLNSPRRREKVEFYRALASELPLDAQSGSPRIETEKASWRRKLTANWAMPRLAFGMAVLAMLLGGWLARENLRLHRRAAEVERQQAMLSQRESELRAQLAAESNRSAALARELEEARQQLAAIGPPQTAVPASVSFVWTLTGLRTPGGDAPRTLSIPAAATSVQLTFKLADSRYGNYRVELRSSDDRVVWSRAELRAARGAVTLRVSASQFGQGAQSLILSGRRAVSLPPPFAQATWTDLGVFPIEVVRQ